MSNNVHEYLKTALDRTVPISDPNYIIGEDENIKEFETWIKSANADNQGLLGSVILGQVGNGKTHFLRFVRKEFNKDNYNAVGIYIPNMFVGGPLVDALNSIYELLFTSPTNRALTEYYDLWIRFYDTKGQTLDKYGNNEIIRYLLNASNKEESELVLDYFSNKQLFPDQLKFLRNKFGAKKRFITNENDFSQAICDALEFIQIVTEKVIILFFDEVDKVYSAETNSSCITMVGRKILSAYRSLFDALNMRKIKGIIAVGATPEAWDILSTQTAFERRFKDRIIKLKVPKSKEDCFKFIIERLKEINYIVSDDDVNILKEIIGKLSEERTKTWADVISNMRSSNQSKQISTVDDPIEIILEILDNSIVPLSWTEILEKSDTLYNIYPKGQPTKILKKLENEGVIKINSTQPKTYESIAKKEDYADA